MDILYSTDHMTELLIQADTTRNIEEPQQKYRLGTASNALLAGRGELKHVLLDPNPCPKLLQWFETFGPHEGFLTHR